MSFNAVYVIIGSNCVFDITLLYLIMLLVTFYNDSNKYICHINYISNWTFLNPKSDNGADNYVVYINVTDKWFNGVYIFIGTFSVNE